MTVGKASEIFEVFLLDAFDEYLDGSQLFCILL
jgi:hypothetical protein